MVERVTRLTVIIKVASRKSHTVIAALAGSLLLALFVESDSPLWVPILVSCFYGAAVTGVSIPLTNSIMNTAPPGEEGSTSAFRSAATNVGSALGVVVMSTIVFTSVSTALSTILAAEGIDSQESTTIAESMRSGATSEQVASDYSVPVAQVNEISTAQGEAMIAGLHTLAVTGSIIAGACVVIFAVGRWPLAAEPGRLGRMTSIPSFGCADLDDRVGVESDTTVTGWNESNCVELVSGHPHLRGMNPDQSAKVDFPT